MLMREINIKQGVIKIGRSVFNKRKYVVILQEQ